MRQPHTVTNPKSTARIKNALHKDRYRAVCSLPMEVNMNTGTKHGIIWNLGFHKLCSQWDPNVRTDHIRNIACQYRYNICSHNILTVMHFWGRLWWGNETQCYHFVLKRKWAGLKWRHPVSSQLKSFWSQASAGKAMTSRNTFFCTSNHVITLSAQTINFKLFERCTPTQRTIAHVNSLTASSCCMTVPVAIWSRVQEQNFFPPK